MSVDITPHNLSTSSKTVNILTIFSEVYYNWEFLTTQIVPEMKYLFNAFLTLPPIPIERTDRRMDGRTGNCKKFVMCMN